MHKTITIQADVVHLLQAMIPKGVWLHDRQLTINAVSC